MKNDKKKKKRIMRLQIMNPSSGEETGLKSIKEPSYFPNFRSQIKIIDYQMPFRGNGIDSMYL